MMQNSQIGTDEKERLTQPVFSSEFGKAVNSSSGVVSYRYKALFMASRDAVMTLEPPTWNFTSGNPATLNMFRVKEESDFLNHEPWFWSPEFQSDGRRSKEKAKEMIEKAMKEGENFFEWTHKRFDGEEFPAEVILSKVDINGNSFLHALVRDVTEQKKLQKKLEEYSEEKFKAIFDASNDGILVADVSTKHFYLANSSISKMLGYSLEELHDLRMNDIHPEEDLPYVIEQFDKQAKGEIKISKNLRVKRKDGSVFFCDVNASPVTIGGKRYLIGIFRDVTEKMMDDEMLFESQKRLILALKSANMGAWHWNIKENIRYFDEQTCGILGLDPITFSGKQEEFFKVLHQDDIEMVKAALSQTVENGVPYNIEYRIIWPDKSIHFVSVRGMLIKDNTGHPDKISGVIWDDTERKKMELHIKELNEIRHKFLEIISHQLRTPLTSINWNLEAVLDGDFGKLEDTTRKFLQFTHKSSLEITGRIHDLLSAMDIEEGHVRLDKEEASLDSLVSSVINTMVPKCELKNLSIQYIAPVKRLPSMEIDSEKIRSVIIKLVENAIFYTKEEGKIFAKLEEVDGKARFTVSDTGVGIPKQEEHYVFERFFRGSNSSVMHTNSFGLGLFIVKSYIEQHGGKVGFESKEGEGSTFWFEIPIKSNS